MTPLHRLQVEQSTLRQNINAALEKEELTEEERAALDGYTKRIQQLETEIRAAIVVDSATIETREATQDSEQRERQELRSNARLGNYLVAHAQGRMPSGAELELQQAANVTGIPLELFLPARREQRETRAESLAPTSGLGVNVDPILPSIFARSVMPRLGCDMPRVESGTYSTMTLTTDLTAAFQTAGAAFTATAAALTPQTTTPHRLTGRLSLRIEDIAAIGVGNFESILRQNLMLVMSDEMDKAGLTGDGTAPNVHGLFPQLTNPTDPTAVVDFDGFVASMANGIDGGPWAEGMTNVMLVVNPDVMRLSETTFQTSTSYKGEMSAASYLRSHSAGYFGNRRMPATDATIAGAIRYRGGTMGLDGVNAIKTSTMPMWDSIDVDDIYSDSASGIRHFTMHILCGNVIVQQASAYERVDLKVA